MIVPEILNIPPKLFPVITDFNKYSRFLLEGGRGSAKTQSVARILLYIGEKRKVRICCGRVIKDSIDQSVKAVFKGLIEEFNLDYTVSEKEIRHNKSGTTIFFKGFRENEIVNVKGLEGVDILWIDEAETVTKRAVDVIVPTIRKPNSKIIFTMNRYVRNDPVYMYCVGRPDCLHISINYFENPFCPDVLIKEAEICKARSEKDYNHIWLGHPLDQANDFLIASSKIEFAKTLKFNSEIIKKHSVMAVDLAGSGGDLNVMKLLTQQSTNGWLEEITEKWSEPDTDITIGKIICFYALYKPDILIIDADGVGYSMVNSIKKSIPKTIAFRGAGKVKNINSNAKNARAEGYLTLKEFLQNGWLKLTCENSCRQLEYLKVIYKPGYVLIQSKDEIRKEQGESPDFADALMMAVYAIDKYSYMFHQDEEQSFGRVITDFNPFE